MNTRHRTPEEQLELDEFCARLDLMNGGPKPLPAKPSLKRVETITAPARPFKPATIPCFL